MADTLPTLALSIRQPWAWAIINADKDVENRDWKTKFRGPVCIHAAKKGARHEYEDAAFFMHFELDPQVVAPLTMDVVYGGIIGVAEIVDCVEASPRRSRHALPRRNGIRHTPARSRRFEGG